ncbi:ABC transporter permease [Microvirga pudoricolor]|uniref:ABC transporter permease n=1 Tax=Microvirga pudoricolor TaxID=2778729 RepID=UPI00195116CE|nr:ABC transporter permease [Microvirga pudoricolor]MBM6593100.1 ABC transporter permease [Microvirga pudoricolor]
MTNRARTTALLLAAPVALTTFAFILPMVEVIRWSLFDGQGFTSEHITTAVTDELFVQVLWQTIVLSAQVAALCVIIGYPVAYYLSMMSGPLQRLCVLLITFPLWVSVLVRTYAWIVVLGREGLLNLMLVELGVVGEPLKLIFTRGAVLVASIQVLLPLAVLIMYGAMSQINRNLIRAARVLGAPPSAAFRMIFLPLSMNGVISSSVLIFILSLGFYVTPALVGGPRDIMISNVIAQQINQTLDWGLGAALGIVLLAAGLLVAGLTYLVLGRFAATANDGGIRS